MLSPAREIPTAKGNTLANLSVYTHAWKPHTNAKKRGSMSVCVLFCEYVYHLLYVCEWFEGAVICVDVFHSVFPGRHSKAHTP